MGSGRPEAARHTILCPRPFLRRRVAVLAQAAAQPAWRAARPAACRRYSMLRSLMERQGDVAVADRRRCPAQDLQADLGHLAARRPIGSGTPDLWLDRVRHANTPRAAIRIPCACSCRRGCPLQPRRSAHSLTEQPQPRMCQTHAPAGLLIPPSASIAARTRRLACNCRSVRSDARPPPSGTSIGRARSGSRPANWKSLWKARPASCMASVTAPDRSSLPKLSGAGARCGRRDHGPPRARGRVAGLASTERSLLIVQRSVDLGAEMPEQPAAGPRRSRISWV